MDDILAKFREAEAQYNALKEKRNNGEITPEQMKSDLKRLMIQDSEGKYWMLGGKSGNWYAHDGTQWQEANPFEQFKQPEQEEEDDDVMALEMSDAVHESDVAEKQFIYLDKDDQMGSDASPAVDSSQQQEAAAGDEDHYVLDKPAAETETLQAGGSEAPHDTGAASQSESDYEIAGVSGNDEFFGGSGAAAPDTASQSDNDYEIAGVSGNDELFGDSEAAAPDTASQSDNDYAIAGVSSNDELFGDSGDSGSASAYDIPDASESQGTYDIADASESESAYNIADASENQGSGYEMVSSTESDGAVDAGEGVESLGGYEMSGAAESEGSFDASQEEQNVPPADEESAATQVVETAEVETSEPVVTIADEREHGHFAAAGTVTPDYITCETCSSRIPPYAAYCMFCGVARKAPGEEAVVSPAGQDMGSELLIKSIKIASLLFFLGGLGLTLGVIFGAAFGIFKDFLVDISELLPLMLKETRGGIAGGMIFAALGGIGGFIASALLSIILSGVYNFIAYIFGGIRFMVKR